ncbi:MAG: endonuclease III [Anaerolineae bacterium]|nr:endonuclease III [Anaerolineae bacterium]
MTTPEFEIDVVMARVAEAVRPYPPAAMFQLADEGFNSAFEQLIACIISIRTYDEVSIPVAHKLFARARTAHDMAALTPTEIATLIADSSFAESKAPQIQAIAQRVVADFGGELPCDRELLLSFKGVGPKCAHLALGIACGQPFISVDIHVHRISNRWGYVQASTPEKTMAALEQKLLEKHWIEINRLLVPFGKHICQGNIPRCSTCPLFDMCSRVGVKSYR